MEATIDRRVNARMEYKVESNESRVMTNLRDSLHTNASLVLWPLTLNIGKYNCKRHHFLRRKSLEIRSQKLLVLIGNVLT